MGASCQEPSPRHGLGAPRGAHGLAGAAIVLGHGGYPRVSQPGGQRSLGLEALLLFSSEDLRAGCAGPTQS